MVNRCVPIHISQHIKWGLLMSILEIVLRYDKWCLFLISLLMILPAQLLSGLCYLVMLEVLGWKPSCAIIFAWLFGGFVLSLPVSIFSVFLARRTQLSIEVFIVSLLHFSLCSALVIVMW